MDSGVRQARQVAVMLCPNHLGSQETFDPGLALRDDSAMQTRVFGVPQTPASGVLSSQENEVENSVHIFSSFLRVSGW
jgi:hypothetical protein